MASDQAKKDDDKKDDDGSENDAASGAAAVIKAIGGSMPPAHALAADRLMWAAAASAGIGATLETVGIAVLAPGLLWQNAGTSLTALGTLICIGGLVPIGLSIWAAFKSIRGYETLEAREAKGPDLKQLSAPQQKPLPTVGPVTAEFEALKRPAVVETTSS